MATVADVLGQLSPQQLMRQEVQGDRIGDVDQGDQPEGDPPAQMVILVDTSTRRGRRQADQQSTLKRGQQPGGPDGQLARKPHLEQDRPQDA